jgi:hypothetical protein
MPPLQLHPNQKLKATFAFNGAVDGEPLIVAQGGFTGMSAQDPKVEGPAPDDATKIQTTCVAHVYCTQPDSIVAGGGGTYPDSSLNGRYLISLPCTATVDNPDTGSTVEKIHEPFEYVAEWIPATQAKATTISMPTLEVEP